MNIDFYSSFHETWKISKISLRLYVLMTDEGKLDKWMKKEEEEEKEVMEWKKLVQGALVFLIFNNLLSLKIYFSWETNWARHENSIDISSTRPSLTQPAFFILFHHLDGWGSERRRRKTTDKENPSESSFHSFSDNFSFIFMRVKENVFLVEWWKKVKKIKNKRKIFSETFIKYSTFIASWENTSERLERTTFCLFLKHAN